MYRIAIPSYKRSHLINDKTLKMLIDDNKIDPTLIDIFVANEEERELYLKDVPRERFGNIIVGVPCIGKQRNFIHYFYPEGQKILQVDDDILGMQVRVNSKKLMKMDDLNIFITEMFNVCEMNGCKIWGVYPVDNPYFMSNKITFDLKYIAAGFMGIINEQDKDLLVELEDKEDFERSIKYFIKYKKVMRVEYVTMNTLYYKTEGGLQATRTLERIKMSAEYLARKYPQFCKMNTGKKGGFPEVRLINRPK